MTMPQETGHSKPTRRDVLRAAVRGTSACALGALGATLLGAKRSGMANTVWQLDPYKCIQCGHCATECVLEISAVKCVHSFDFCGYCDYCSGFFDPDCTDLTTAAENQLCPAGAIIRLKVEEERFEYTIDESLCVGCGRCVKGCAAFGNGSLFLQVRHDRCLNCNECSIAAACPSDAYSRVPVERPYRLKGADPGE